MAKAMRAPARPTVIFNALMGAFSVEIAANSSLPSRSPAFVRPFSLC
jgi:hypothetical protein